jgi:hypothetical protein
MRPLRGSGFRFIAYLPLPALSIQRALADLNRKNAGAGKPGDERSAHVRRFGRAVLITTQPVSSPMRAIISETKATAAANAMPKAEALAMADTSASDLVSGQRGHKVGTSVEGGMASSRST